MVVQVQTKLLVPARVAGAIIGKQCSMLKLIRESSGAQLEVLPQAHAPLWPNDRVVILKGNLAGRKAALEMVLRVAFQSEEQQTVAFKLLISSHMAGGVIGRQGGNLKAMRARCNVGVQMGRYDYAGERLVTANGPLHSIVNAAMMVLDHAESAPAWKSGGQVRREPVTTPFPLKPSTQLHHNQQPIYTTHQYRAY